MNNTTVNVELAITGYLNRIFHHDIATEEENEIRNFVVKTYEGMKAINETTIFPMSFIPNKTYIIILH